MKDIIFEIVKLVVMVVALIIARYVIPWIKGIIEANNLDVVATWVMNAVLYAQQVYSEDTGEARKEIVVEFLKGLLEDKKISITDEQLNTLIEAAVKEMKLQESEVVTVEDSKTE